MGAAPITWGSRSLKAPVRAQVDGSPFLSRLPFVISVLVLNRRLVHGVLDAWRSNGCRFLVLGTQLWGRRVRRGWRGCRRAG